MRLHILVPVLILGCALPAIAGDAGPRPWKTIRDPRAPIPAPASIPLLKNAARRSRNGEAACRRAGENP